MQVTADMISTFGGTSFPLDQRRRDALANYCTHAARGAGQPVQTWIRKTFDFEVYEAKEVIRGNSSEALWERIVKHPNGGWRVVIPVMGAVIGMDVKDWYKVQLAETERRLAREQEQYRAQHAESMAMARALGAVFGHGPRADAEPDAGPDRLGGERHGPLGREEHREAVEPRSFGGAE